jgi:hypothetical protein
MMAAIGEVLSPVADVPLLGDLMGFLDGAATEAGLPFWLRTFAELVAAGLLTYVLLRVATGRLLPWAGTALLVPAAMVTKATVVVLLLPDLGVSRVVRRFGRTPPEFVYGYGAAVVGVVEAVEELLRRALPKLSLTRSMRPWLLILLLVAWFLVWNHVDCAAGTDSSCVSPVQLWTSSFGGA